ncbi:DUF4407 domain-containing protein [Pseudoflavitalea sp. G-6-1-2]|uniref:DUF4407 domain-containing protein n=1 Tax=Pseudoflavitalea sp. G-6-1-2 TaxID=2728841 RepID=UPI00146A8168|nr:DUF4407 domain-containing protein [Pseudoflavitalea sp. G-6-1-2]NML21532.1 DUF4407 domain-containing protein [Pseudoflavitalea sp. G-6-1-2]
MADTNQGQADGLYSYESFGGEPSRKSNSRFLWWCAGAHQQLLHQYPSEHSKYSGLGGAILATFVLASLSAGYAIYSVFGNWGWTLLFGLVWGLIIFNFDRFLVATMRKYGVSREKQLRMAVPRMLLALLIGITISRPLELKIFEKEIDTQVTKNLHKKMQENDSLLQIEHRQQLDQTTLERNRLSQRKLAIEDTLHRLRQSYIMEADGTGGSQQRGVDKLARLKMEAYNAALLQFRPELSAIDDGLRRQDSLLASTHQGLEQKRKEYEAAAKSNVGFLERNKALSDLADEESSVFWTSVLLSLLIILIEVGPVLSKLIMPVGPYDIALAQEELTKMAAAENEMRKDKELTSEKKRSFYRKQKEVSEELVDKLSKLQQKHIDEELDKWERGEWNPKDHRASMDEVMRKIRERYKLNEEDML